MLLHEMLAISFIFFVIHVVNLCSVGAHLNNQIIHSFFLCIPGLSEKGCRIGGGHPNNFAFKRGKLRQKYIYNIISIGI